jgi:hypothetical protein
MSSFADLIANDESADESYASESSDNVEDEDKLNATEAVVLSANPPGTAPGCLLISRDVWEVVRLSDSIIREDCHVQIEKLVEAIDALLANNTPLPDDMHTVHRLLLTANRFWRTSKAANEASEEQNGLWYRYHMFKSYESAISLLQSTLRPVAATWHSARRAAILQKHGAEVTKLMRDDPLTPACMLLMVYAHIWVALHLEDLQEFVLGEGSSSSLGLGFASAFVAAALFGGFCAFGFQALDHELSHCASLVPPWVGGDKYSSKVNTAFCHGLGVLGSACTAVPWFSYYFSGGALFVEPATTFFSFNVCHLLISHACLNSIFKGMLGTTSLLGLRRTLTARPSSGRGNGPQREFPTPLWEVVRIMSRKKIKSLL